MKSVHANGLRKVAGVLVGVGTVAVPAFATGTDFSSILTGLDGSTIVEAILGAAAILALVGFGKWGAKKLGKFFG